MTSLSSVYVFPDKNQTLQLSAEELLDPDDMSTFSTPRCSVDLIQTHRSAAPNHDIFNSFNITSSDPTQVRDAKSADLEISHNPVVISMPTSDSAVQTSFKANYSMDSQEGSTSKPHNTTGDSISSIKDFLQDPCDPLDNHKSQRLDPPFQPSSTPKLQDGLFGTQKQSSMSQNLHTGPQSQGPKAQGHSHHLSSCLKARRHSHVKHPRFSGTESTFSPLESLVQMENTCRSAKNKANTASTQLSQLLIRCNIINRLRASLQRHNYTLSANSQLDPSKFSFHYLQAIDFCSSMLKDTPLQASTYMASLKSTNRQLLNSFLTLVKTSPSFICACLSKMNENDISAFFSSSIDPSETLNSLHRCNALDIIFHSFFPPTAPISQKLQYFSFIVGFLLDSNSNGKFNKICLAILHKITLLSSSRHLEALEPIILGCLQDGTFLLKSASASFSPKKRASFDIPDSPLSSHIQDTTSAPSSVQPSPQMPFASLKISTNLYPPSPYLNPTTSPSISFHHATAQPSFSSSQNSYDTISTPIPLMDELNMDSKSLEFINKAVFEFLVYLSSVDGAIPYELLDFSHRVLSKLSRKKRGKASNFIFVNFFFKHYVSSIFRSPEGYGIARDFIISEKQRQQILLIIYQVCVHYVEVVILGKFPDTPVPAETRRIISSIHEAFLPDMSADDGDNTTLDNDTTLQTGIFDADLLNNSADHLVREETFTTGQLFVLSSTDIATLYSSLFPSSTSWNFSFSFPARPVNSSSVESFASSQTVNKSSCDSTAYSFVESRSSITEEINDAMYDTSFFQGGSSVDQTNYFASNADSGSETPYFGSKDDPFEWNLSDIQLDIAPAISELSKKFLHLQFRPPHASQTFHSLRSNSHTSRLPQPFHEKWQIFCIDANNTVTDIDQSSIIDKLSPPKEEDYLCSSSSTKGDCAKDPSLCNVEIPAILTGLKYSHQMKIVTTALSDLILEYSASLHLPKFQSRKAGGLKTFYRSDTQSGPEFPTFLLDALSEAAENFVGYGNFMKGSEYFHAAHVLKLLLPSTSSSCYAQVCSEINEYIISHVKMNKEKELQKVTCQLQLYEEISEPYKVFQASASNACHSILSLLDDLRTKIWYITEVRTTSVWTRARDIALTLNCGPDQSDSSASTVEGVELCRSRSQSFTQRSSLKRTSSTSSLSSLAAFTSLKRFTGSQKRDPTKRPSLAPLSSGDGIFAPPKYGGKSKLSDRDSEVTKKWLCGEQIQNFCTGEERIHRFCCEIDDLVKRIFGDALSSSRNRGQSVLTSSNLFKHDLWKLIMEVEGVDRSSTTSVSSYTSKMSFYNFGSNSTNNLDTEYSSSARRSSIESLPADVFYAANNRAKVLRHNQTDSWAHPLRAHKSRKSSPNLMETFSSSLQLSGKRVSSEFLNAKPDPRQLSFNETYRGRQGMSDNFSPTGNGKFEESGPSVSFSDEVPGVGNENGQKELDQLILQLQMRLISFIYTDIGFEGWSEG